MTVDYPEYLLQLSISGGAICILHAACRYVTTPAYPHESRNYWSFMATAVFVLFFAVECWENSTIANKRGCIIGSKKKFLEERTRWRVFLVFFQV